MFSLAFYFFLHSLIRAVVFQFLPKYLACPIAVKHKFFNYLFFSLAQLEIKVLLKREVPKRVVAYFTRFTVFTSRFGTVKLMVNFYD